jgi:anaerobic magnesium-protoporphyrin IX monomethyl ester cyclase
MKNKKLTVIVPAVVVHNLDPHTGIPFLPHMAGHLAGMLDELEYDVQVIDCFGMDSNQRTIEDDFMIIGVSPDIVVSTIEENSKIAFIYCRTIEDLLSVEKIMEAIKKDKRNIKICIFENIQTTNSFSLLHIIDYLFEKGCDAAIMSEPERRLGKIVEGLLGNRELNDISDFAYRQNNEIKINPKGTFDDDLDTLPFPLWEKWQLQGYWSAGYAHAPVKRKSKFLPILSSRGCPYRCTFCVSPTLNPTWRMRSAKNVVDEMEYFYLKMGITDFHFSDLDPTVNSERTKEICKQLIMKKMPIEWKLSQGTKIETVKDVETVGLMQKAGLTFFSFSPESGSKELMKKLKKPFDYEHAIKILKELNRLDIKTQACFIAGTPEETELDRQKSIDYVKRLVKAGVDEIAVFIYSPIPGSALADQVDGYNHFSELTRSPVWRKDYKSLKKYRMKMYKTFFLYKLLFFPQKVIFEIYRIFKREFKTKMEMSIFKLVKLRLLYYFPSLFPNVITK